MARISPSDAAPANRSTQGFSLSEDLFNAHTTAQLAGEFAVLPGFDAARFQHAVLTGLGRLGLLERMEHIATCAEAQLPRDFNAMAEALEASMPAPLDPGLRDDDFGQFIHAVPGILAVRHGLEDHRDRALDLLHAATRRFSMEFYIRPFLNRWPDETLARLRLWAEDDNYHVRRLVSEGTRPRLPWARNITLDPLVPLDLLDRLHADPSRYVTRSVANHLNDITKIDAVAVLGQLSGWQSDARQSGKELGWMTRHALRSLIKQGHEGAMAHLGYAPEADVQVSDLSLGGAVFAPGDSLEISATLTAPQITPVIVDYVLHFARPGGKTATKVFKFRTTEITKAPLILRKRHVLKANATTFTLYPGDHALELQINGRARARCAFELKG